MTKKKKDKSTNNDLQNITTSLSPIQRGFAPCFVNYKKGCTRLSPGSLASSTTKTGLHDIAESGVKHNESNLAGREPTPYWW
jgi:hypothetical protein